MLRSLQSKRSYKTNAACVRVLALLDKQVYSLNSADLLAFSVHNHAVVFPAKHVHGKVRVLLLEFINLWSSCWEVYSCESHAVFYRVTSRCYWIFPLGAGNRAARITYLRQRLSLFCMLRIAFSFCSFFGSGMWLPSRNSWYWGTLRNAAKIPSITQPDCLWEHASISPFTSWIIVALSLLHQL